MSLTEIFLKARGQDLMILGLDWSNRPLLKARLPLDPCHPRAAITLLEGLALWSGRCLPTAFSVGDLSASSIAALLPEGSPWCSPLVDIHLIEPHRRSRDLGGVGNFRALHALRLPVLR